MVLTPVSYFNSYSSANSRVIQKCVALLLVLAAGTLVNSVYAQEPESGDVVRVSTDLSVFPIRVRARNRSGQIQLTADDFQLKDPDQVTTSSYFASGADHVALVFALDESGSLRQILSQQRDAALALFERFGANSRVAVLRFSDRSTVAVPFGNDSVSARSAFTFPARRDSHTTIFDAAGDALKLFADAPRDPTERRIVILISDGLDNTSVRSAASIIAAAQTSNVSFYTIQVPLFEPRDGHLAVRGPSKGFKELAEKTGGKYFLTADARTALAPTQNQNFTAVFRAIEEDLRSQYVIGFYVGDKARDDRLHKVSITVKNSDVEYSVAQYGFAKTHDFSIKLAPRKSNE